MRRRRRMYKFTEKRHSRRAIVSFAVSSVLLIVYLAFVYLAYSRTEGVSAYYGSIGVMAMLVSVVSLIVSATSFIDEDSFQLFPRLSLITSILSTLCWVGTYILGFIRG